MDIVGMIKEMSWNRTDGVVNHYWSQTGEWRYDLTVLETKMLMFGAFKGEQAMYLTLRGDVINLIPLAIHIAKNSGGVK